MRRARRGDAGSTTIELAIVAPAVLAMFALVVIGGRVNLARQVMEASAFDAARTASLARTAGDAQGQATAAGTATLNSQGMTCTSTNVIVDVSGFGTPVGQPATVTATVTCQASMSDVALPGLPGSFSLSAEFTSPLDTYRTRK
jgi:Flp pilus assembly protein TadG